MQILFKPWYILHQTWRVIKTYTFTCVSQLSRLGRIAIVCQDLDPDSYLVHYSSYNDDFHPALLMRINAMSFVSKFNSISFLLLFFSGFYDSSTKYDNNNAVSSRFGAALNFIY